MVETLGAPAAALLRFLESTTGSWAMAIVIAAVLFRLAVLPIAWQKYRTSRTLALLTPHIVRLHKAHDKDPEAYHQKFIKLYGNNKVSPMATTFWVGSQTLLLFMMIFGVVSLYHELKGAMWLGQPLLAPAVSTRHGIVLLVLEQLVLVIFFYMGRKFYKQATWYMRWSFMIFTMALILVFAILMPVVLLLYFLVAISLNLFEFPLLKYLATFHYGKRGWPIYDEAGHVVNYGFEGLASDDGSEGQLI